MRHNKTNSALVIPALIVVCVLLTNSLPTSTYCVSGGNPNRTASQAQDIDSLDEFDIDGFVKFNCGRLAIDTSGPEPEISVIIETNGDFSELEAMGIATGAEGGSREGNFVHVWIPVRLIPRLLESGSVVGYLFGTATRDIMRYGSSTSPGTGVVSGVLIGLDLDLTKNMQFEVTSLAIDSTGDDDLIIDSVFTRVARITPSAGRFRIMHIPPGLYRGTIYLDTANDTSSLSTRKSESMAVIDSIMVKQNMVSLISVENLSEKCDKRGKYYVWLEKFKELEKYEQ